MITRRTPRPDEASILTGLCLRSKAVWGHDAAFMEACREELTILPRTMLSSYFQVADIGCHLAGVVQVTVNGDTAELDKLFIEPSGLRAGTGSVLLEWAMNKARENGATAAADRGPSGRIGVLPAQGRHRRGHRPFRLDTGTISPAAQAEALSRPGTSPRDVDSHQLNGFAGHDRDLRLVADRHTVTRVRGHTVHRDRARHGHQIELAALVQRQPHRFTGA